MNLVLQEVAKHEIRPVTKTAQRNQSAMESRRISITLRSSNEAVIRW